MTRGLICATLATMNAPPDAVIETPTAPDNQASPPDPLVRMSTHVPGYQRNAVIAFGAAHGVGMAEALRRILDDWLARSCGGPKTR